MKIIFRLFSILFFCIGLSAVAGGYGLIFMNGLGMPVAYLRPTFDSFLIPGLILAGIVGGTHIIAAVMLWRESKFASEVVAIAGFGILIWIFTELYIVREPHWLQIVYFGGGIITLVFDMLWLKSKNRLKG